MGGAAHVKSCTHFGNLVSTGTPNNDSTRLDTKATELETAFYPCLLDRSVSENKREIGYSDPESKK